MLTEGDALLSSIISLSAKAPKRFQTCSDVATEIVQPLNPPNMICYLLVTIMPPVRIRLTACILRGQGLAFTIRGNGELGQVVGSCA